jgi:SSS family solute:Na+ symporter
MNPGYLLDALVIVSYFVLIVAIGLYKSRGEQSMSAFAIGDRTIPWWAVLASILAAEISAATFLGAPNEGYVLKNFTYAQLAIGTILARIVIAYVFIKPYYDYRVVSIYEFLLVRFGQATKNAASAVFLVTRALASGTRLYVAAVVLVLGYEKITGAKLLPLQEVGVYVVALVFLTAVTALYTAAGGIKAVVWTDLIQASIMFGALGYAIWTLLRSVPGGWNAALQVLDSPTDLAFFDSGWMKERGFWQNTRAILETEYTIFAAVLGSTFLTMATHGTDQDMVQRMLTAKDHTRSRLALILSGLADLPLVVCFLLVGILLWVFYQEPGKSHPFAHFILDHVPIGARGLLVAGIFATAMGSLSTALNALATSFTEDWYVPYIRRGASEREVVRAARWSTVAFSILLVVIGSATAYAVVILKSRVIPIVLGIFGYTYGSLLGVFLVGMLTRSRGSNRGNLLAMSFGFVAVALLSGLHNDLWLLAHPAAVAGAAVKPLWKPDWLPAVEFPWRILFGTLVTSGVALFFRTPEAQIQTAAQRSARLQAASAVNYNPVSDLK